MNKVTPITVVTNLPLCFLSIHCFIILIVRLILIINTSHIQLLYTLTYKSTLTGYSAFAYLRYTANSHKKNFFRNQPSVIDISLWNLV